MGAIPVLGHLELVSVVAVAAVLEFVVLLYMILLLIIR